MLIKIELIKNFFSRGPRGIIRQRPIESQSAARPSFLSAARASPAFISIIIDSELKR